MPAVVFSIFLNLFVCMNMLFILQYIFSGHLNLSYRNLFFIALLCTALLSITEVFGLETLCIPVVFLGVILAILLFSQKKGTDLLLLFPSAAFYFLVQIMPEMFLSYLFPAILQNHTIMGVETSAYTFLGDPIMFIILFILRYTLQKYELVMNLSWKEMIGALFLFFLSFVEILLLALLDSYCSSQTGQLIWKSCIILTFLFGIAAYLWLLVSARIRIYQQCLASKETELLKVQLEALHYSKENEDIVRKLRHDLKNHLTVLETLCKNQQYDDILNYTQKLSSSLPVSITAFSGNQIADTILNCKMKLAAEHNIDFSFEGSLSSLNKLEAPDICALLANAYDNALEACQQQEHAYIRTVANTSRNYTMIEIRNSVNKKVKISNNTAPTSKADSTSHGYGLQIIKQISSKYHGKCTVCCTETEFTLCIYLLT